MVESLNLFLEWAARLAIRRVAPMSATLASVRVFVQRFFLSPAGVCTRWALEALESQGHNFGIRGQERRHCWILDIGSVAPPPPAARNVKLMLGRSSDPEGNSTVGHVFALSYTGGSTMCDVRHTLSVVVLARAFRNVGVQQFIELSGAAPRSWQGVCQGIGSHR